MLDKIQCNLCNSIFETDVDWVRQNGRVFCPSCCKSFEVDVKPTEDTDEDYLGDFYD
jgi:hypothetical protein